MKKFIIIVNCLLIMLIPLTIYKTKPTTKVVETSADVKKVKSSVLAAEKMTFVSDEIIETKDEEIKEVEEEKTISKVKPTTNKVVEVAPTPTPTPVPTPAPTITDNSGNILTGKLTGYGYDCKGCSGVLSCGGRYVGGGNIYYNDSTYGTIRIVAGDRSFPCGTIVRIGASKASSTPIIAIVLDRGSAIGIGKYALFDLLFESEAEAGKYSTTSGVEFEVLRRGY